MQPHPFEASIKKNSSVVVFGGAGFIGTHLLERLAKAGFEHLISVDIKEPKRRISGVTYHIHDIRDLSGFEDGLDLVDPVFFNFAAVHTTPGHEPWEYYSTNITGALEVTKLARRCNVTSMVFTSSISVYGPDEMAKDENTTPTPNSDYGHSKLMSEYVHRDWANEDESRRLVICRPAVVFGLGEGGNFTRLTKMLKKGLIVYPGRKDTIKSCIYVKDLLDWILTAMTLEDCQITFNGSYSNRYTIEQIVETFELVAFPKVRSVMVPAAVLRTAATILRPVSASTGLGIHPDRIAKLMVSTNILPTWAEKNGFDTKDRLQGALEDWFKDGQSSFA